MKLGEFGVRFGAICCVLVVSFCEEEINLYKSIRRTGGDV